MKFAPITSEGLCASMANDLAGAKGATPRDDMKIAMVQERMIAQGCVTREQAAGL